MADVAQFRYTATDSFYVMVVKQQDRKFAFFCDILTRGHCMGQGDMCFACFFKPGYKRNDVIVKGEAGCSGCHGQGKAEEGGWVGFFQRSTLS